MDTSLISRSLKHSFAFCPIRDTSTISRLHHNFCFCFSFVFRVEGLCLSHHLRPERPLSIKEDGDDKKDGEIQRARSSTGR